MSYKCPVCQADRSPSDNIQQYRMDELSLNLTSGDLTYKGLSIHLTPVQAMFFDAIASAYPKFCRREALKIGLVNREGAASIKDTENNLGVHISRLRGMLQEMGLGLETRYTEGLRLNHKPGTRYKETWTYEERMKLIEERNKGTSWYDLGKMFSCKMETARGVATYAAKKFNLPLLSRTKIKSRGARAGVFRPYRGNAIR